MTIVATLTNSSLVIVPIVAETVPVTLAETTGESGKIVPMVAGTVEVGGVADTNEEGGVGLTTLDNVEGSKEKVAEVVDEVGVEVEMLEEEGKGRLWQGGQLPHYTTYISTPSPFLPSVFPIHFLPLVFAFSDHFSSGRATYNEPMRIAQQVPTELGVIAAAETRQVFVRAGGVALVGYGGDESEDGGEGEEFHG